MDVSAMKHIAYVFDALVYYTRYGASKSNDSSRPSSVEDRYSPVRLSFFLLTKHFHLKLSRSLFAQDAMFVDENENDGDDLTSAASFIDPSFSRSQQARL
jgi:hypothetical protein